MAGETTITPGIVFGDEILDTTKLNLATTPIAIINDGAITFAKIDSGSTLIAPVSQQLLSTDSTPDYTCTQHRADQMARLTLTRNVVLNFIGLVNGMYGFLLTTQAGAGNYTVGVPAGSYISPDGVNPLVMSVGVGKQDIIAWTYMGDVLYVAKNLNFT